MKKNDNPYSFYVLDSSSLNSVFYNTDNNNIIYSYSLQKNNIIQLYDFSNNSTALFRKIQNNDFALLYDTYNDTEDENLHHINICTPQTYYSGDLKSNNFTNISSMHKKDFLFLANTFGNVADIPGIGNIANKLSNKYVLNHLNTIVYDGKFINTKENHTFEKEFRSKYMRYKMATTLIPVQYATKQILSIIIQGLATEKFDENAFYTNYLHLKNFEEFCSETLQKIHEFYTNKDVVSYANLCDYLRNKITNMDKLINMYLSDELEKDNKSL